MIRDEIQPSYLARQRIVGIKNNGKMKTIELTDEEIELIDNALTWFWEKTMDWVDAEAKKYNGYNPAGCKEVAELVKTAIYHHKVGELMSRFDDYLEEIKGKDELDKIAEHYEKCSL